MDTAIYTGHLKRTGKGAKQLTRELTYLISHRYSVHTTTDYLDILLRILKRDFLQVHNVFHSSVT